MRRPRLSLSRILWGILMLLGGAAVKWIFGRDDQGKVVRAAPTKRKPSPSYEWERVPDTPVAAAAPATSKGKRSGPKFPFRRFIFVAVLMLLAGAVTYALFTQTTTNAADTYSSKADFRAPTVDRSVIQPNGGNNASAGFVDQSQSYFVYANVTDTGNPASGISSVTANVCNVTTASCSAVAMVAGSYTVNSVTYNYRSAAQTSDAGVTAGSKSYSVAATDVATNTGSTNFNVTVDPTAPTVSKVVCGGSGCTSDYVGTGKTYFVYAQVADASSGVNTVTTDPRTITAAASATTAMTAAGGPWTIGGSSYNYRSAQLTADTGFTDGSTKAYTINATDNVSNATAPSGTATVDNTAPTLSGLALDKNFGRFHDYVKSSAPYFLYADASDAASGIDTSTGTANAAVDVANTLSTGKTSVKMCYSASGYSLPSYHNTPNDVYDFKSDASGTCSSFTTLTSDASIPDGSRNWQASITDNAGNTATLSKAANVDSTANTATSAKIINAGGATIGKLELGDQVNYTFSSGTDPASVLSGWTGNSNDSSSNVVARLTDGGGTCVASSDQLQVWNAANTTQTNIGTVCLGSAGYNTSGSTITFGLTGTPSTLESGFTNPLQLTLGTPSAAAATQATDTTATWTPGSGMYDLAGNATSTATASNSIDNTAPAISAIRLCGGSSCAANYVGQSKSYFVYANATDASGISGTTGVTADVSSITSGATAVALPTCSSGCTVNGTTYAYKSAQQTSSGTVTGTPSWNVKATDANSNSATSSTTATVDTTAPTIGTTTIAKSTGTGLYLTGKIKPSGTYYVYANVTDAASGVDTVTANVNNITSGSTAVAMTAGAFSVNGVAYGYRSAALTAGAGLTNGATPTYSLTAIDNAVNTATTATPTVTIDSVVPTANTTTKVAATNQTGTVSKPDVGDKIVYTYSEQIDPESILAGWTGASTNVTVRLNNNTACPSSANANDNVTIFNTANTTQANIGCVDTLTTAYVTANVTFGQTGSTTLSTMVQSGNTITITLGSTTGTTVTTAGTRNMIWWPSASAFDAASNLETATSQAETDTDTDF